MKAAAGDPKRQKAPPESSRQGSRARKRKRRGGVTFIAPTESHPKWRARYVDPDSEKHKWLTPDPVAMGSAEAREAWAKRFVRDVLGKRRAELQAGAARRVGKPIADAIADYYRGPGARLRERTRTTYQWATDAFAEWCERERIESTDELTPERLYAFREAAAAVKRKHVRKGGKSGEREPSAAARAPATTNRVLRPVASVLGVWRKAGLVPQLHSDDIRDRLEQLDVPRKDIDFLTAAQCRQLLISCLDHDAKAVRGSRRIAPFTVALLLGGFRSGEALNLEWSQVHLDQGVIRLPPSSTKTNIGRRVTLAESPALAKLLEAMRPDPAEGSVFGQTEAGVQMARTRLIAKYNAPRFTWQQLRRTCATFSWNMTGANPHRAAKRAGHGVAVAESRYADLVDVPSDARTLEAAMQIESEIERVITVTTERDA